MLQIKIITVLVMLLFIDSCISLHRHEEILYKQQNMFKAKLDSVIQINRYLQSDLNNALFELTE